MFLKKFIVVVVILTSFDGLMNIEAREGRYEKRMIEKYYQKFERIFNQMFEGYKNKEKKYGTNNPCLWKICSKPLKGNGLIVKYKSTGRTSLKEHLFFREATGKIFYIKMNSN